MENPVNTTAKNAQNRKCVKSNGELGSKAKIFSRYSLINISISCISIVIILSVIFCYSFVDDIADKLISLFCEVDMVTFH